MSDATFDPGTATLVASPEAIEALRRVAGGEDTGGDAPPQRELERAGVLGEDGLHPELEATLRAMADAVCEVTLERGDRSGRAWVDARVAVLLVPEPDGRLRLATLPTSFLPAALARLNDVGPRPRVEPAVRLRFGAGELASLLAGGGAVGVAAATGPEAAALRALLAGLRAHWRVEARWSPAADSSGVRVVEVVDAEAGLWLVIPDDLQVELWPTTPTHVFRHLAALLPASHELAESPA